MTDTREAVANIVSAYVAGRVSETEFIDAVVALPMVKRAPLPDTDWYDGIVVNHGPIYELRHQVYEGGIPAELYARAVKVMLEAGHEA